MREGTTGEKRKNRRERTMQKLTEGTIDKKGEAEEGEKC